MQDTIDAILGGGSLSVLALFVYYLRSVNTNLKEIVITIREMKEVQANHNTQIATIIVHRKNDSTKIDELREDVREMQRRCKFCTFGDS